MCSILFVTYGWNENGGGTLFPRAVAVELARRGYSVSVFYASLKSDPSVSPYALEKHKEDGVTLYGLYNRPALFTDPDHPEREIDDPLVRGRFCQVLDDVQPALVHFHNFHGLTLSLAEETFMRGIPSCYTPHNYHLIDPELYLLKQGLEQWGSLDLLEESDAVARNPDKQELYRQRAVVARKLANQWVTLVLAVSCREKELLSRFGIDEQRIAVLHQAMPETDRLWATQVGSPAEEGGAARPIRFGVLGGLLPIKGIHMAVAACQAFASHELELHLFGFIADDYREQLRLLDRNSVCRFHGAYHVSDLPHFASLLDIGLVPSVVEESAPTLVLAELQALRLPVIAARIGGIPEYITEGVDGLLYRHDDLHDLVRVMQHCIHHPDLVRSMRLNLMGPIQTFQRYMDHLEKVYAVLHSGGSLDASALSCQAVKREEQRGKPVLPLNIHWQGGLFVHHSLSLVNRELCLQLLNSGCRLSFECMTPDQYRPAPGSRLEQLAGLSRQSAGSPDVTVRHFWPPDFTRPSQGRLVVIQPWEYGSIPSAWVEPINSSVDQIWVPSGFVRECYLRAGIEPDKVLVIPNGVDTGRFHPQVSPQVLATDKRFRFLFVGGTIHRKGIDLLLAAYSAAFAADDDVCLVIKEMGAGSIYQGQTAQEMVYAFQRVPSHPELLYLHEDIDDDLMPGLYTACQCLVHPYRGEGFGLPIAEAMASGLLPIVTGYGAALDYCSSDTAWLIPAVEQRLPAKIIGNMETVDYPWLAEPSLETLITLMRKAYDNQQEVRQTGLRAADYIRQHLSWEQAADKACAALRQLVPASAPLSPEEGHPAATVSAQQDRACEQAWARFARGETDQAVELLLQHGIRLDSSAPQPYCVLTELLLAAERYQDALDVIAEMPESVQPAQRTELELLARCGLGDDEQVVAHAVQVIQRPRVQVALGTVAARRGALSDAETCFRQALAYDENCAAAWRALTIVSWTNGLMQDAWYAAQRAVSLEPMHEAGLNVAVDIAGRLGYESQVLTLLGTLVRQYPGYRALAGQYADLLLKHEGGQQALAAVERFLAVFGVDEQLLEAGLQIRRRLGAKQIVPQGARPAISLCMIVKNEEQFLAGCLQSVQPIVDELILLDTGSTDRTVSIAQLFGAQVSEFVWNGSFADARNRSLEQAHGDWILIMDADEQLASQDHQRVLDLVRGSSATDAWSVLIRTYSNRVQVQGWTANDGRYPAEEQADGWYPASRVRLFPRHPAVRYEGAVHELLEPALRRLKFEIRQAPFVVHHYAEVAGLPENLRAKQLRYYELGKQKLADAPGNLEALYELAVQAGELGLFEEAVVLWDRMLEYSPGQLDALFNKGHILMNLKQYEAARDLSRHVLQADPTRREAAFNYATCELYVGSPEAAYQLVCGYLEKDQDYPLLQALHVVLGLATNRIADACLSYAALLTRQYAIQAYIGARLSVLRELGRDEVADTIQHAAQTAQIEL